MRPSLALSSPAIRRSVVVLPQPDGPSSVTSVPGAISSDRGFSATTSPNRLVTFSNRTEPFMGTPSMGFDTVGAAQLAAPMISCRARMAASMVTISTVA
jgi:hypothetical protein